MINVIMDFIGSIILVITALYIVNIILNNDTNLINIKTILVIILTSTIIMINYNYSPPMFKLFTTTIVIFASFKIILNTSIRQTLFAVFLEQLIVIISEFIFIFAVMLIFDVKNQNELQNFIGNLPANILISIISVIIIKIKLVNKSLNKLTKCLEKISFNNLNKTVLLLLLSLLVVDLLSAVIYYKVSIITVLIINNIFVCFSIFILYKVFENKNKLVEEQNRIVQYKTENYALINNLNAYERMADHHRVINHENKNQLSTIKQMIQNNDTKVIGYIDSLIGTSMPDNERLIDKTKRIPSGGLQGIIYQKMLTMNKLNIKYNLIISRDLKELDFKKLDLDTTVELCKILGVYIDNAIQAVLKLNEKLIDIEIFVEDTKLCVSVANNYGKKVDFSKIDEPGYTTRGKNHGYGLVLVKEILESNKRFENERRVTPKYFKQIIKIKRMKNKHKKKK